MKFEPGMDQIVVVDLIVMTVIGETTGASEAVVPMDATEFDSVETTDPELPIEALVALPVDEVVGDASALVSAVVLLAKGAEVVVGLGI